VIVVSNQSSGQVQIKDQYAPANLQAYGPPLDPSQFINQLAGMLEYVFPELAGIIVLFLIGKGMERVFLGKDKEKDFVDILAEKVAERLKEQR
jgi:hypothetical protein